MKIRSLKYVVVIVCLLMIGSANVKALSTQPLKAGDKVCVDTNVLDKYYAYVWGDIGSNGWPGTEMIKETNSDVWCYVPSIDGYSKIIFTDTSKQTIDLSTLGGGLVYVFDETDKIIDGNQYGKYAGKWHIYDKSALVNLVDEVSNYEESDYTITTYQNLLEVLNGDSSTIGAAELATKDYKADEMVVRDTGSGYTSTYEEVYNNLVSAKNALVKRHKIIVKSTSGGSVVADYKENSDTDVTIITTANLGYNLTALKVTNIIGYDGSGQPILGTDVKEYTINDNNTYDYIITDSDIYIEAIYNKIVYTITVDGKNYDVSYGTTYAELLAMIDSTKDGYNFIGLKDEDDNLLTDDYEALKDDVLNAVYEKNETVSENVKENQTTDNPYTSDTILKYVIILGCTLIALGSMFIFKKIK